MTKNNTSFADRSQTLLKQAADGHSGVLLVHGVSGVGQSDAVTAIKAGVSSVSGGLVLEGRCSVQAAKAFEPIHGIVGTLQLCASGDCDPGLLSAVTTRLAQVVVQLDEDGTPLRRMDQLGGIRDSRVNRYEDVRRLLCEVAQKRPTVVVVHDIHFADDDTLCLLEYLVRDINGGVPIIGASAHRSARPAMVFTVNDDTPMGRRTLRRFQTHSVVESVPIAPLDNDGLAAMLTEPVLSSKLMRLTEGRPARLRALVSALPNDLDELIRYRLTALDSQSLHVLRVLEAASTTSAIPGTLASVADVAWSVLNELKAEEFLVDEVVDGKSHVRLNDAYARHSILAPSSDDEKHAIHDAWSQYWTEQYDASGDEVQQLRAFRHLLQSERVEEAASIALRLHQWLAQNGGLQQSAELLESVLSVASTHQSELTIALIDVHVSMGCFERALDLCNDLVDSADTYVDLRRAQIHGLQGDLDAANIALSTLYNADDMPADLRQVVTCEWIDVLIRKGALDEAETLCDALDDPPETVSLSRGKIAFWRGDYQAATDAYDTLLTGRNPERVALRAIVLHNLGLVDLRVGQYRQATHRLQEALALFEQNARYFEATVCRHNLGIAYEFGQRLGLAISMFEQTIDGFERLGKQANLAGAINSLGDLYLGIGEYWKARRLFEHSQSIAEKNGLDYMCAFNDLRLGQVARLEGATSDAMDRLERARSSLETLGHTHELMEARLALAQCAYDRQDTSAARTHLKTILGSEHEESEARAQLVQASMDRAKHPTRALDAVERAEQVLDRLEQWSGVAEAWWVMGAIFAHAGRTAEANEAYEKGRAVVARWRGNVPEQHRDAFDAQRLIVELNNAVSQPAAAAPPKAAPKQSAPVISDDQPIQYRGIIGRSQGMLRVFKTIDRIATADATILVTGESGTGKELIAQAIFEASNRADKPFVRVNAAAYADSLLESELFGHEKGSFTGAVARKIGAFEQADGGTLFLDEIGDISPKMQVSLLRALQEGEVRRVGGRLPIHVNVRVVCATNRDLDQMVKEGTFRQDLYFRVKGLPIELPALRDRGEDLNLIANHILAGLAEQYDRTLFLDESASAILRRHTWPGNVRELENVLRSVIFFVDDDTITEADLLQHTALKDMGFDESVALVDVSVPENIEAGFDLAEAKRVMEIEYIQRALDQTNGNITQAAALLSMKRPRLSQKIKEYRLKGRL